MSIEKQFQGDIEEPAGARCLLPVPASTGQEPMSQSKGDSHSARSERNFHSISSGHHDTVRPAGDHRRSGLRTGELAGIAGTLDIEIVEGKHYYSFDYTLP